MWPALTVLGRGVKARRMHVSRLNATNACRKCDERNVWPDVAVVVAVVVAVIGVVVGTVVLHRGLSAEPRF